MPERSLMDAVKPVRRRILFPLVVTLLIFLVLFSLGTREFLRRSHERGLDLQYKVVQGLFHDLIEEHRRLIELSLSQLTEAEELRRAMASGDRQALLAAARPHYETLLRLGITHFYVHDPEGVNVLRVHQPERHGDRIDRLTLRQAMESGRQGGGVELGPLGTFTLRVVAPWGDPAERLGYLELGMEVAPLIERVKTLTEVELLVTIAKEQLDPDGWARGMRMLGRTPDWGRFPERVILEQTHEGLAGKVGAYLRPPFLTGEKMVELRIEEHSFAGRFLPLKNAGGTQVGEMLVLLSDDPFQQTVLHAMGLTVLLCVLFGTVLTWTSASILGRFDRRLLATHRALVSSHENLERRVEERTEELGRQNRLLHDLIAHIPDVVSWKDRDGLHRGGNPRFLELLGMKDESALIGRSDAELEWPAELTGVLARQAENVARSGEAQVDQEVAVPPKRMAGTRYFLVTTVPVGGADAPQGLLTILRDVTAHKLEDAELERAFAEARTARDRLNGILASVPDALFVTDAEDRLVLLNAAAESLLGIAAGEALGAPVRKVIGRSWLASDLGNALDLRRDGLQFDAIRQGAAGGHDQVFQVRTSVLTGASENYEGQVFAARDVSEERRMDRLKSQFISTAAHELRTPLTVIYGFAELLLESDFSPEERKEYLRFIFDKAETMSELLDDLLDLSRLESGRPLELKKASVSARELFEPNLAAYRRQTSTHSFEVEISEPEGELLADAAKIGQVMDNLLSNAIKYSPGGGVIRIVGRQVGGGYRVAISDQGIGMTEAQSRRAFEKFYRADASDTAVQGTGLGLTIVEHIVKAHGGDIRIESIPGEGTTVWFVLPLSVAPEGGEADRL